MLRLLITGGLGFIGSHLVDNLSKKNNDTLFGRTENNRVVNFEGSRSLIGNFVNIKITEALSNSLRGIIQSSELDRVANL